MLIKCKGTKLDSVLTVLCRIHRKCVRNAAFVKNKISDPLLDITKATLFMPNQILKRFEKKYIDFHQKFAKIEDFKVDYSKKTTKIIDNHQNPSNFAIGFPVQKIRVLKI